MRCSVVHRQYYTIYHYIFNMILYDKGDRAYVKEYYNLRAIYRYFSLYTMTFNFTIFIRSLGSDFLFINHPAPELVRLPSCCRAPLTRQDSHFHQVFHPAAADFILKCWLGYFVSIYQEPPGPLYDIFVFFGLVSKS